MGDEPARKKRGAESDLHQDNWNDDEEGNEGEMEGEFKKASAEELAKRKIVKVRRGGGGAPVPDAVAEKPAAPEPSKPFSWTASAAPPAETKDSVDKKDGKETAKEGEESKTEAGSNGTKEQAGDSKPALFGSTSGGSLAGFGSSTGSGFSFGTTGSSFSFGSVGSGGGFSFGGAGAKASFASVGTQGWSTKKDGEEEEETGADEDAEKEVVVKKGDGVVQLEEVETCTGEEDELCVFQARAKLFTFGEKAKEGEEGGEKKEEEAKEKAKEEGAPTAHCWNVTGIGNIKVNIPKEGCADKSRRPRIVMRRQKTFQVCLNTYLFETMVCDKAGPKDVRFTGMKNDSQKELATYLLRVKEEEAADEFVTLVNKHKKSSES